MAKRKKTPVRMQVIGRSLTYEQSVSKSGKLGKARPVLLTQVRVLGATPTTAPAKKRRKKR